VGRLPLATKHESAPGAETPRPMTRHATSLLLATAANMTVIPILSLLISAILTRTSNPDAAIGGFAVALGIAMFVGLPQLRIQQLTLVFFDNPTSLQQLRKFVGFWVVLVTALSLLVVLPPITEFLMTSVFSVTGDLKQNAADALIWLIPLPGLLVLKMHYYGAVLRISRPRLAWIGTGTGAFTVAAVAFGLFTTELLQGASIAAFAMTAGTLAEMLTLAVLAARPLKRFEGVPSQSDTSLRAMAWFFWPLLFAAMLPAGTAPILNAGMARSPEPDVSIAAVALSLNVFHLIAVATNGTQNTSLALFASHYNPFRVRRYALSVGLITFAVVSIIAYVPPVTDFVIGDIMGAEGRLKELSSTGFRLLSILPIALVMEQLYTAALMRTRNTRPILYINTLRGITLTVWVIATVNFTDLNGLWVGAGAWTLTLLSEAIYAYIFGRKNLSRVTLV
jgi:progressive ankylosis protein